MSARWPVIASALLAIALYAVSLNGTFVYDDVVIAGSDPRLHDVGKWGDIWTKDYFNGGLDNLYRPLVTQSYAIQWWIRARLAGDRFAPASTQPTTSRAATA